MTSLLAFFDFDHSIIDENSDIVLLKLLPEHVIQDPEFRKLRNNWTIFMARTFELLHEEGISKEDILKTCGNLKPVDGMMDFINYLGEKDAKIFIVSDSNSVIISTWVQKNLPNLNFEMVTNPAHWSADGVLKVSPFDSQTECKRCNVNMCKGQIVTEILEREKAKCLKAFYVGDGQNDLCPSSKLRETDFVFSRQNFKLDKLLKEHPIVAKIVPWTDAKQIRETLEQDEKRGGI